MPVPKRRVFRSRRRNRLAHQKIKGKNVSLCPKCHEPKLPHYVCPHCGEYKGRKFLAIKL